MVDYRYVDAENEVLRMRLKESRDAAVALKKLIGGGGYLSKAKVCEIQQKLDLIICTRR